MRRITNREIKRLLSTHGTPEPPAGLADRIKAEIPEVLQVGGAAPGPEGVRGFPSRSPALRPLWLLAASLLVVIGAGFVAVRFFAPGSDLAREIALGGVVRIEDIVVTVPERSAVERVQAAAAPVVGSRTDKRTGFVPPLREARTKVEALREAEEATRNEGPSPRGGALDVTVTDGTEPGAAVAITATAADAMREKARNAASGKDGRAESGPLPPRDRGVQAQRDGFHARETTPPVAPGAKGRTDTVLGQQEATEGVVAAAPSAASAAQVHGAAKSTERAVAKGSVVVTVRDRDGKPVAGATVLLAFGDRPDVGCGFRVTGKAGVATFCCVAPGTYRVCTQNPGFEPTAQGGLVVSSGGQLAVELRMARRVGDATAEPWTCPTPGPTGNP